jgi:hypothetical protein
MDCNRNKHRRWRSITCNKILERMSVKEAVSCKNNKKKRPPIMTSKEKFRGW